MGNQRHYLQKGSFSEYLYYDHPDFDVVEINGISGKAILHIDIPDGGHYSLPFYSDTSNMYFRVEKTGIVSQAKLYKDRKTIIDFDWDHPHTNKTGGRHFEAGLVHVQEYSVDGKGKIIRHSKQARLMTDEEIQKYGPIIHAFNRNVKIR